MKNKTNSQKHMIKLCVFFHIKDHTLFSGESALHLHLPANWTSKKSI